MQQVTSHRFFYRRIIYVVIYLYLSVVGTSARAMDLVEVYQRAVSSSQGLRIAEANMQAGRQYKNIQRSALLPQLNAFANYEKSDTNTNGLFPITLDQDQNSITPEIRALRPVDNQTDDLRESWGASLSQVIFDASAWFNFRHGAHVSQQAYYEYLGAQQTLIVDVVSRYVEVLRLYDNYQLSLAQQQLETQQLDQIVKRSDVGVSASADVIQAQASLDLSVSARLDDADALGQAIDHLAALLNLDYQAISQLQSMNNESIVILPEPMDEQRWINAALENNLHIQIARAEFNAAMAKSKSAFSRHWPTIAAEFRYNESDNESDEIDSGLPFEFDSQTRSKMLLITANVPLYAGGRTQASHRQARYQQFSASEAFDATVIDIKRQTKSTFRSIKTGIQQMAAKDKALASTQQALKMIDRGYRAGIHSISDVLAAQKSVYRAQRDRLNSRYEHRLYLLQLKYLAGIVTSKDVQQLNALLSDKLIDVGI